MSDWKVIGVDPAPSKKTAVCVNGSTCEKIPASGLRAFLESEIVDSKDVLIAWDSPLSYDGSFGYYRRPVDVAVQLYLKDNTKRLKPGAVSILPFAGCSHWAMSCDVIGFPFGCRPGNLRIARKRRDLEQGGPVVVEVHPAVSIALWWIAMGPDSPLKRYKTGRSGKDPVGADEARKARQQIATGLPSIETPNWAMKDDDYLDAWVAWKMGRQWIDNSGSCMVGDAESGAYILPASIGDGINKYIEQSRADLEKRANQ